ncbi:MAG: hypothetical protein KIT72_11630 [Polyangiaceae bacterium]|nr:hypothetical protein [Polyangiaceae bacterium]MCW5791064.1 hypothetical protein [Polyangiaceae bacterium]
MGWGFSGGFTSGWAAAWLLFGALIGASPDVAKAEAPDPEPPPREVTLWVDDDDDDLDGVVDREDSALSATLGDERLTLPGEGWALRAGDARRAALWRGGRRSSADAKGTARGSGALLLQGLQPGVVGLSSQGSGLRLTARVLQAFRVELGPGDEARSAWVAPAHGSVRRTLPVEKNDPERFAVGVMGPQGQLPAELWLTSTTERGRQLDQLGPLTLKEVACPLALSGAAGAGHAEGAAGEGNAQGLACAVTEGLSLVGMLADRLHPRLGPALRVAIDGRVELDVAAEPSPARAPAELRVVGPDLGAAVPRRGVARLRVHVLRQAAGGTPAVGGSDRGAEQVMTRELADATALFAQCGVSFEVEAVRVVDPPPPSLVAFGCARGALTGGGSVAFEVEGRRLEVTLPAGLTPLAAARLAAAAARRLGFRAEISRNAAVAFAEIPSVDLLLFKKDGAPARLAPLSVDGRAQPVGRDAALGVCLGEVNLADGLSHFSDFSSGAGTLEERSLLKALMGDDPTEVDVVVIPSFAGSGRIGESFIYTDGSGLRSAVIVDHAGLRSGSQSFVLAHELGHVLLALPGHPDDFGVDDPTHLMDSDAADPSSFGPRRLTRADCQRLWRQSGGKAGLVTARRTGVPALDAAFEGASQASGPR